MTGRHELPGYSKRSFTCIKSGLTFVQAGTSKRKSKHDSGYGTAPPTPSSDSDTQRPPKLHDQNVSEELEHRFQDLKIKYNKDFVDATADKGYGGDVAMKLRCLVHENGQSEACIVIEGRTKALKRIRKLLVREDVRKSIRPHFRICLIDAEPVRLALDELKSIHVMGDFEGRTSFCGMDIHATLSTASRSATFGGLVVVEKTNGKFLFGLTAGHPVTSLQKEASGTMLDLEDDLDTDEESDIDEDLELYVPDIGHPNSIGNLGAYTNRMRLSAAEHMETAIHGDDFSSKNTASIGAIMADSFSCTDGEHGSNHDWALIDLTCEKLLPNGTNAQIKERGIGPGIESVSFHCPATASKTAGPGATVLTPRGNMHGRLSEVKSSILMAPGKVFVDTYDFIPNTRSQLERGDSGSWVVDVTTGEVFGHVVSVDAMGEAFVMPMQATFGSIVECLGVNSVALPTKEQVECYTKPHGAVLETEVASHRSGRAENHTLQTGERVDVPGNTLGSSMNREDQPGKLSRDNSSRTSGTERSVISQKSLTFPNSGPLESRSNSCFQKVSAREDAGWEERPGSNSGVELKGGSEDSEEEFPQREKHGKGIIRQMINLFSKGSAADATGRDPEAESAPLHGGTGRERKTQPPTQSHTGVPKPSHPWPAPRLGIDSGYATMVNSPAYPAPEEARTQQHSTHGERSDGRGRAFGRHYTT